MVDFPASHVRDFGRVSWHASFQLHPEGNLLVWRSFLKLRVVSEGTILVGWDGKKHQGWHKPHTGEETQAGVFWFFWKYTEVY